MKIAIMTVEFSKLARIAKQAERKFNYWKYRLSGNRYKVWTCTFPVGGHQDVVTSFLNGAAFFPDVEVLINPALEAITSDVILYVPSGWRAFRDAVYHKAGGRISKLVAGPLLSVHPEMYDYAAEDPRIDQNNFAAAVDLQLAASDWYRALLLSDLCGIGQTMNIKTWPAGVNEMFWKPEKSEPAPNFRKALLYAKHYEESLLHDVLALLQKQGKEVKVLHYGMHTPGDYKMLLDWCDFEIILGHTETQGLGMTQAWAMNRQTLVFDSGFFVVSQIGEKIGASAAPYLTEYTGAKWKSTEELDNLLSQMGPRSPRQWVMENQTDKIAFADLRKIIEENC